MSKKPVSIRLEVDLIERIQNLANTENRNFTNMVEHALTTYADAKDA